jgi:hypothetical protein
MKTSFVSKSPNMTNSVPAPNTKQVKWLALVVCTQDEPKLLSYSVFLNPSRPTLVQYLEKCPSKALQVKIKMSLCLTKHHAMKTYWGVEVQLHEFLITALNWGAWSASRSDRFTTVTHWTGGCMGHRENLSAAAERKYSTIPPAGWGLPRLLLLLFHEHPPPQIPYYVTYNLRNCR